MTGMRANLEKSLDIKKTAPSCSTRSTRPSSGASRMPTSRTPSPPARHHDQAHDGRRGHQRSRVRGLGHRLQHRHAQQPHPRPDDDAPRPGLRRAAGGAHHRRRRAQVPAGLRRRGQHRRHRQPAHRERLRQPRAARRRARRGQLQRACPSSTASKYSAFVEQHQRDAHARLRAGRGVLEATTCAPIR